MNSTGVQTMQIIEPMKLRQKMISEKLQVGGLAVLGLLLAAAISSFVPLPAMAQAETGILTGTLTDPNGAVISGARIKIVNAGTGATREATSDSQGNYVASNLLPALYEISVEATGFAANKAQAQVTVGSRVTVNFQLTVGGTQ